MFRRWICSLDSDPEGDGEGQGGAGQKFVTKEELQSMLTGMFDSNRDKMATQIVKQMPTLMKQHGFQQRNDDDDDLELESPVVKNLVKNVMPKLQNLETETAMRNAHENLEKLIKRNLKQGGFGDLVEKVDLRKDLVSNDPASISAREDAIWESIGKAFGETNKPIDEKEIAKRVQDGVSAELKKRGIYTVDTSGVGSGSGKYTREDLEKMTPAQIMSIPKEERYRILQGG